MKKVAVLLAPGFEEAEAIVTIDILRRLHINVEILSLRRDTKNAKTGQRKYEKTIFRILCVKPPKSGGFLSMI